MPKVGIVMGSDSDLAVMKDAADVLQEFGIDYEITICSAHRLPEETARYAATAIDRGLAVPIQRGAWAGVDALYAIVQMPRGIPVATVAINGSANAALLAVQMLAMSDPGLRQALQDYRRKMARSVLDKNEKLQQLGVKGYLER